MKPSLFVASVFIFLLVGCKNESPKVLLVGNTQGNSIVSLDARLGKYRNDFIPSGSGGLSAPDDLIFGPDGSLYISSGSDTTGQILRFHGTTGEFMNVFAQDSNMIRPYGLAFGPDGNLFVASFRTDKILKFNGTSGDFIGVVASGNGKEDGLLNGPNDLLFGADGKLYVTTQGSVADGLGGITFRFKSQVIRYDLATFQGEVFAPSPPPIPGGSGYVSMLGLATGPDHLIYVTDFGGGIRSYDPKTKELKQTISTGALFGGSISTTVGNLTFCFGKLYAPVFNTSNGAVVQNGILVCDIVTGKFQLLRDDESHLARPIGINVVQ